jgi:V/A-type H+-transporting ATPase subunit E
MSDADDISGLEAALAERARKLSEEHLVNGRQTRELMLAETRQRLQIEQGREELAAKARAERISRQRVQAAELDLRADLDRVRWELIDAAFSKLNERLAALVADEAQYLPLLRSYLRESAQAIERDELVAQFNARDMQRLQENWEQYALEAAPGKRLTLSPQPLNSIGGVLITSADRCIRFDNTFEGRMERQTEILHGVIAERLTRQIGDVTNGHL